MSVTIKLRRDTEANWGGKILADGEIGYTNNGTNKGKFKIGNGTDFWEDLPYQGNVAATAPITYNTSTGAVGLNIGTGLTTSGGALVPDFGTTSSKPLVGSHAGTASGVHGVTGNVLGTTDSQSVSNKTFVNNKNSTSVIAQSVGATSYVDLNIDLDTALNWFYTGNAAGNYTLNFRSSGSATLASKLANHEEVVVKFSHQNGGTPYYPTAFKIDGTALTGATGIRWENGAPPAAGIAGAIYQYTFEIMKESTGYTVLGSFKYYTTASVAGQIAFTTPGTYSWTVPTGVTSVSAVTVGAGGGSNSGRSGSDEGYGGGGGGGLAYGTISVTPGEVLTVVVGAGGAESTGGGEGGGGSEAYGGDGGTSSLKRSTTLLIQATGGKGAPDEGTPAAVGGTGSLGTGVVGGAYTGGAGALGGYSKGGGGGGGAAGYYGNGGNGGAYLNTGFAAVAGSGGAGGGGGASTVTTAGAGGGGTGILGFTNTGNGGSVATGGIGGSGGVSGFYTTSGSRNGGDFGGGAGGCGQNATSGGTYTAVGGNGAVRIIWGDNRAYPALNTGNV